MNLHSWINFGFNSSPYQHVVKNHCKREKFVCLKMDHCGYVVRFGEKQLAGPFKLSTRYKQMKVR